MEGGRGQIWWRTQGLIGIGADPPRQLGFGSDDLLFAPGDVSVSPRHPFLFDDQFDPWVAGESSL